MTTVIPRYFDQKNYTYIPSGEQYKGDGCLDNEEVMLVDPNTNETRKYTGPITFNWSQFDNITNGNNSTNSTNSTDSNDIDSSASNIVFIAMTFCIVIAIVMAAVTYGIVIHRKSHAQQGIVYEET